MPVTVEQIKVEFPEFANTSAGLVLAKLGEAQSRLSEAEFGMLHDQAVKYLTCHLVAMSPGGEHARLKYPHLEKNGEATTYERTLNALKRTLVGPMVV